MLQINFIAVLVSAVVAFILGFLFHGPVSGKLWMKLANIHPTGNEKLSDMIPQMAWNLFSNIVTAAVMAMIFGLVFSSSLMGPATWLRGAIMGVLLWLGFLVTSSSIDVIWMGKNYKLWLFECGCSLVVMSVIGAILASW
ncbi:MAG: DUF1761 domain-containing protein [Candidatus Nomurabacteria bacterium]|nr:DUF1761 domain-containing protein [Candidatus Nomurabacteria bacterium]